MTNKLDFEWRKMVELTLNSNNANDHPPEQIEKLAMVLKKYKKVMPIVIKDDIVYAGEGRYLAFEFLGLEEIPTVNKSDLTDDQIRLYALADNQDRRLSGLDYGVVAAELKWINDFDADYNLDIIGFNENEIERLLTDVEDYSYDEDGDFNEPDDFEDNVDVQNVRMGEYTIPVSVDSLDALLSSIRVVVGDDYDKVIEKIKGRLTL